MHISQNVFFVKWHKSQNFCIIKVNLNFNILKNSMILKMLY